MVPDHVVNITPLGCAAPPVWRGSGAIYINALVASNLNRHTGEGPSHVGDDGYHLIHSHGVANKNGYQLDYFIYPGGDRKNSRKVQKKIKSRQTAKE